MFSYAVTSVRCLLVLVLALSALGKVRHRSALAQFGDTLRTGLRFPMARAVARAWVALEGATAVGLALPPTLGYAALVAVAEFGCLTAGAAVLVAQHRGFACNCFGSGRSQLTWWTVARNGALTAAALLLALALRLRAPAVTAPVLLAAVLTVALSAVLVWQARPLRALIGQAGGWPRAGRSVTPRSALSGGPR